MKQTNKILFVLILFLGLANLSYSVSLNEIILSIFGDRSAIILLEPTLNQGLYSDSVWPTVSTDVSSPFGPRLKASDNFRYDFHKGIDIAGNLNDPVYSIDEGVVYNIYPDGSSTYPNGGNVIVIRHTPKEPILFHGNYYTRYYSVYMHLNEILIQPNQFVNKGQVIGKMGHSGTTDFNHLHFEIRVQTTCSQEYQIANPKASCSQVFLVPTDPHVNPFLFLNYKNRGNMDVQVLRSNPLKIKISSDNKELDFNSVYVVYGKKEKKIDLNLREGIDPLNMDNNLYDGVLISPLKFNKDSSKYEIEITFNNFKNYDFIEVRDIFGKGVKLSK
ncbi:MAG: M23 family metallopeptidase [Candidatus Micrarchaeia archaeon]